MRNIVPMSVGCHWMYESVGMRSSTLIIEKILQRQESFVSTPSPCSSSCGEIALSLSKLTRLVPEKSENHQQNRAKFQQVGYGRWEKVAKFPFGKFFSFCGFTDSFRIE